MYTGRENHKYVEWFVFTVIMGAIPLIIRLVIYSCFNQHLLFSDFRADLFFLSIMLVVDSLKNYGIKSIGGIISIIILITGIISYSIAFFDMSNLLIRAPSGDFMQRIAVATLVGGFISDLYSVSKK